MNTVSIHELRALVSLGYVAPEPREAKVELLPCIVNRDAKAVAHDLYTARATLRALWSARSLIIRRAAEPRAVDFIDIITGAYTPKRLVKLRAPDHGIVMSLDGVGPDHDYLKQTRELQKRILALEFDLRIAEVQERYPELYM